MRTIFSRIISVLLLASLFCGCSSSGGGSNPPPEEHFSVVSSAPADGEANVYIWDTVTVTFDEPVDIATVNESSFYIADMADSSIMAGSISAAPDYTSVSFTPVGISFAADVSHAVTLTDSIKSLSGKSLNPHSFTFKATGVPQIEPSELYRKIFTEFSAPTVIDIRSAEEIAAGSIAGSIFISYEDIVNGVALALPADLDLEIFLASSDGNDGFVATSMLASMGYANATNLSGGIAGWTDAGYPLQDGTEGEFLIVSVAPATGAENVSVNQVITVTFTTPPNPASVNATTFAVKKASDGSAVAGTFNVSDRTATFTLEATDEYPFNLFSPDEQYIITLENIADFSNNHLPLSLYSFTTTDYRRMPSASVFSLTNVPNNNYFIIDLRELSDIHDGLVKYSNYISFDTIMGDDFSGLPSDMNQNIILISQDGKNSELAASHLAQKGYIGAISMEGGIDGWLEASYPLANIYFTSDTLPNYFEGPTWKHFYWDTVATSLTSYEYKLEKEGVTTIDWTPTTLKNVSIYLEFDGQYIFSLRLAGDPASTIMYSFEVYGCG